MKKIYLLLSIFMAFSGALLAQQVMEDFESLTMNYMSGGAEDAGTMIVKPNPDKSGCNLSSYVVEFFRDKDGVAWGGFYGTLAAPIDFDTYKYIHVKVWKPRISPVKFKIEGGATGNIEVASMNTQTVVNGWEDMVFDFTDATGEYTKIVFMPDFNDPVDLTEDITIYFDDIIASNDPNPMTAPSLKLNVDMSAAGMAGEPVYVSGAFGGAYGNWPEPGSVPALEMTDPDVDGIYTVTLNLPDDLYAFKFFKGTGWGGGDNAPGGDRVLQFTSNMEVSYKFGTQGEISSTSDEKYIAENYEFLKMNSMDASTFTIEPNPDPSGVNLSSYVTHMHRAKDGVVWSGFYGTLSSPVNFDTDKYVHVKVMKSRISPIKFKIEGGATGNIEVASTNAQTAVNQWEDFVFDFSNATGDYSKIVFMPDFNDPVDLTEDIEIYFDDIRLNSDPDPMTPPVQTINVDMRGSGLGDGQQVFISGALGGIYGTWAEPGTNANNEMFDLDQDSVYTIDLSLPDGVISFKFFKGTGWNSGDPAPGGDRTVTVAGSMTVSYKWGVDGEIVLGIPGTLAGMVSMYPNPVNDELNITTTADLKRVTIYTITGQVAGVYDVNSASTLTINTSGLRSGAYLVSFEGTDGARSTAKLMKN
ncbi:MAG: T9SS type A sorting domain-containing protein [Bacteroidota bacterium]